MNSRLCWLLVGLMLVPWAPQDAVGRSEGALVDVLIESQPLDAALNLWAMQTGFSVLVPFNPGAEGKLAPRVAGAFAAEDSLQRLLKGSNLQYDLINPRTIAIRLAGGPPRGGSTFSTLAAQSDESAVSTREANNSDVPNGREATRSGPQTGRGIPEVIVTGGRILNTDIKRTSDEAQPYVVFDRETLERSGAQTIEAFLMSRLGAGTNSVSTVQQNGGLSSSRINLRGLGSDETLILVDGRRAASSTVLGSTFQADINSIPLAAIERIEVLPSTASGIYGGGATGGVVNVILRHDYRGVEAAVTYGNTFSRDADSRRVDVSAGTALEGGRTNLLLTGSWADTGTLFVGDRDFATLARQHVLALRGIAGFEPTARELPIGATTNIRSANGANLTLRGSNIALGSTRTFIPYGYAGVASDGGMALVSNAGKYNFDIPDSAQLIGTGGSGNEGSLLNSPTVQFFSGTLRRSFLPAVDGYVEFSTSKNDGSFERTPALSTISMPASAAANPFNEPILIATPTLGLDSESAFVVRTTRGAGGVIVKLPSAWSLSLDYTWNKTRNWGSTPASLNTAAATTAINTGALNIFRDTNAFATDFFSYVLPPRVFTPSNSTLSDTTLRLTGSIPVALPGGKPTLTSLLEHRREVFGDQYAILPLTATTTLTFLFPSQSQEVDSAYMETLLPLVGSENSRLGLQLLELQIAGRFDKYRTVGASSVTVDSNLQPLSPITHAHNSATSVDPTVAMRYRPIRDVTLRGSFGTGFLPPAVNQLSRAAPFTSTPVGVTDPLRGNEPLGAVAVTNGGNPDLDPEKSRSWSAGLILTPRFAPGLRFSADWSRIQKRDNITAFGALNSSANLATFLSIAPARITRGAPSAGFAVGPIVAVDQSLINIALLKVEAIDLALDYRLETSRFGGFQLTAGATKLISLRTQLTDLSPVVENVGVGPAANINATDVGSSALKWRASGTLSWDYRNFTLGWAVRFYDSYFLNVAHSADLNQGAAKIASQTYHDLFGAYRLGDATSGFTLLENSEIRFGVNNVFNKSPPLDVVGTGANSPGYSYLGDPRLSNYYLTIRKSFTSH